MNHITSQLLINQQFLSKVTLIRKHLKPIKNPINQSQDFDQQLFDIISQVTLDDTSLTDQLRLELYKKIHDIFGTGWQAIPESAITRSIAELSQLILEKYIEPKPEYAQSFSRNYGNLVIKEWLKSFFELPIEEALGKSKTAVRIFMDMNGVGKLNLIGRPFHSLSKTIGKFVTLLKTSHTATIIRNAGLEYKLSIDGGDEFSLFIFDPLGKIDVFAIMPEIKYSLLSEMESTIVNNLLDQSKMEKYFEKGSVPNIHLSSSFGYTSFWQLINSLSIEELRNKDCEQFLDFLCLRWFDLNYFEASKFKLEYKQAKIAENPKLYSFLFTK
ncbi:MAG: hypothetical protein H7230_00115 [Candidatus Parcubacteria bacterium]|nr:hypothetical protein [Candidatus Paceibacterota bacterium]